MQDLVNIAEEIYQSGKRLQAGSDKLFSLAKEMAEAERIYRRALQIEIVKLKNEGMSVTLIPDIARGMTADQKFKRDLSEAQYKSAKDMLNAIQSQLNGLQSLLKIQKDI